VKILRKGTVRGTLCPITVLYFYYQILLSGTLAYIWVYVIEVDGHDSGFTAASLAADFGLWLLFFRFFSVHSSTCAVSKEKKVIMFL